MQELLETVETHQHIVNQVNFREVIRKRQKHKSGNKMEIRSYSIQKFFEAMKNSGNCPVKQRFSNSSGNECSNSTAVKSNNDLRNVLVDLKNSMIGKNKITNYFKDVKYAANSSNSTLPNGTGKENVANNDNLKKKTVRNIMKSLKLNSTTSHLIKQKLQRDSSSGNQCEQTCSRYIEDISEVVEIEEEMHIEQTPVNQRTSFEQFTEKVCEQIRNKSLRSVKLDTIHEKVCDRQIMDQHPISIFIESLGQKNTNESAELVTGIFDSSPSSKCLTDFSRLAPYETKSHEDIKIFTEQANPRFHFSEPEDVNSNSNTENVKESIESTKYSSNSRFCNSELKLVDNLKTIERFTMDRNGDIHENSSTIENNSKEITDFAENWENSQFLKMLMPGIKYKEIITNPPSSVSEQKLENSIWIKQVSETNSSEIIERDEDNDFVNKSIRNSQLNFEQNDSEQGYQYTPHQMNAQNHLDEKYGINSGKVIGNYAGNINLMQDEEIRSILTENYEKHKRLIGRQGPKNKSHIDSLCTKLNSPGQQERKCQFKRFKKGKVKIYRMAKLRKSAPNIDESETLNVDELLKKMSQGFVGMNSNLAPSKSSSSVSTTSSYITDETSSETLSTGSRELSSPQRNLRKGLNEICKDRSFFCDEKQCICDEYDPDKIKMKIQNIFLQVLEDLTNGRKPLLKYRRQSFENCTVKDGRLQFKSDDVRLSVIKSGVQRSHGRFKLILFILKKIQMLLETNTKMTKREIFYQLKHLIGDQRVTDRAINSISCLLDVGMWALNIVAQKGLVFGNLKILLASGETINCNVPGTLIPQDIGEIVEIHSTAYFILVVEKESIFHKLIEEDLPNRLTRPFVMITGKGFPDLNTQLFLKKLWTVMCVPVFLLVDADPDGINIMLNYRFGSVNNAHVSHHLAVPNAKWLGVFPSEIADANVKRHPLSAREAKMASQLLRTPYMADNPRIAVELNVLIEKNYKAGIEGLIKSDVYLSEVYLPTKFFDKDFI